MCSSHSLCRVQQNFPARTLHGFKYFHSVAQPSSLVLSTPSRVIKTALTVFGLAAAATSVQATSLVVNGNFEQLLQPGASLEFGSRYPSQQITGWSTNGYNFVFTAGSADTTGAVGEYAGLSLWGPNKGSDNGLPDASPAGGNFLGMDGAYAVGPLSQTINDLHPGQATLVSFYWAGAQQAGFNGLNTEQFRVSLGSQNQFTPVLQNANHGFTGWRQETMTFVPTSTSEVLSFLAIGTPNGVPPFSLLDGVSMTNSPEPASWALLCLTFAGFGGLSLRCKFTQIRRR